MRGIAEKINFYAPKYLGNFQSIEQFSKKLVGKTG